MLIRYRLTCRVWPEPWHVGHGSLISVPVPPHFEHGCEIEKRPCPCDSMPRPWQREQTVGCVPGLAPVPRQVGHGAATVTETGTCAPSSACSNAMCTSVSRSRPRSGWLRVPAAPPPPEPKRSDRMSPIPPKPGPPAPPPRRNALGSKPEPKMPPPESYWRRFSGSDRIEYAPWTSLKRSSADGSSGLRSGWYLRASLR